MRLLAVLEFAQPALLAGAAAAVLPFVIHWLLRPRPRRVAFPAVAFLSAALASGLRGIEERLDLPEAVTGNAYEDPKALENPLPSTLREASGLLRESKMARAEFGDAFVDHYAATRDWEDRENRKAVTDWDLARYFEII